MATVLPSRNPRSLLAIVFGDKPKTEAPAPKAKPAAKKKPKAKKAGKAKR